jgi:hypothetical protein
METAVPHGGPLAAAPEAARRWPAE